MTFILDGRIINHQLTVGVLTNMTVFVALRVKRHAEITTILIERIRLTLRTILNTSGNRTEIILKTIELNDVDTAVSFLRVNVPVIELFEMLLVSRHPLNIILITQMIIIIELITESGKPLTELRMRVTHSLYIKTCIIIQIEFAVLGNIMGIKRVINNTEITNQLIKRLLALDFSNANRITVEITR